MSDTMKKGKLYSVYALLLLTGLSFSACSDDNDPAAVQPDLEVKTVADLDANKTKVIKNENDEDVTLPVPTYFSLSEGKEVPASDSASTKWDIAFSGTSIILNGGVSGPAAAAGQVVEGIFEELTEAPESGYKEDAEGEPGISKDWYRYTAMEEPQHAILPVAGKILVVKTADGNYAKMEIISYYKGNPDTSSPGFVNTDQRQVESPSRYYTFRYVYQPDGSRELQ